MISQQSRPDPPGQPRARSARQRPHMRQHGPTLMESIDKDPVPLRPILPKAPSSQSTLSDEEPPDEGSAKPVVVELNFINVSALGHDAHTKRAIRAHVSRFHHAKKLNAAAQKATVPKVKRKASGSPEVPSRLPSRESSEAASVVSAKTSPVSVVGFVSGDPFASYVFPVTRMDEFLLNHYVAHLAWTVDRAFEGQFERPMTTKFMPEALFKEPLMLDIVLLDAACSFERKTQGVQASQVALFHRGRTIRAINKALNNPELRWSDSMVMVLTMLGWNEYIYGTPEAYGHHATALKNIVATRGGLDKLGMEGFVSALVVKIDLGCAFLRNAEPYFEQKIRIGDSTITDAPIPPGFEAVRHVVHFSVDLIVVLRQIYALTQAVGSNASVNDPAALSNLENNSLVLRVNNRQHGTSSDFQELMQRTTILAMETHRSRILCGYPIAMLGGPVIGSEIQKALDLLDPGALQREVQALLLWIAYVCSWTSDEEAAVETCARWIAGLQRTLRLTKWEDVQAVCARFLWAGERSDVLGRSTWVRADAF